MKIVFYSERQFEDWDWTNPETKGIGGSETSQIEMSWRLAQRGHEVLSYAPVSWEGEREWRGVRWTHFSKVDFSEDALWIVYRTPAVADSLGARRPEQPRWLICQDVTYAAFSRERCERFDRIVPLCGDHATFLANNVDGAKDKLWQSSNGIKTEGMRAIERSRKIERNPKKLIYASSPDRGLATLLKIFKKAHALDKELELHVFYGFNNMDCLLMGQEPWKDEVLRTRKEVEKYLHQPGVVFRGRVGQEELWAEYLSSGLWCYPTDFTETSCITAMEAQALGAIPITNPIWALADNVGWGVHIEGRPQFDPLVRDRYAAEILHLTRDVSIQERLRAPMMEWARTFYSWERMVDQWESEIIGFKPGSFSAQFAFHFKYAKGRVLNVGSSFDTAGFAKNGAVNMDVTPIDPVFQTATNYHVLHDAREPFPACIGKFDTVVLSEILEHIPLQEWPDVLANAAAVLNPGGQILMSVPLDDQRSMEEQFRYVEDPARRLQAINAKPEYVANCHAYHDQELSKDQILDIVEQCGLTADIVQPLDYGLYGGLALRLWTSPSAKPTKKPTLRALQSA